MGRQAPARTHVPAVACVHACMHMFMQVCVGVCTSACVGACSGACACACVYVLEQIGFVKHAKKSFGSPFVLAKGHAGVTQRASGEPRL
eukprot:1146433-Pelagomonas_calceolata.AAC.6